MAKKSSYQKLKEEVEELKKQSEGYYHALKRSVQGTMGYEELFLYKTRFRIDDDTEKSFWMGETSCSLKDGDEVVFNGIGHKVIKQK